MVVSLSAARFIGTGTIFYVILFTARVFSWLQDDDLRQPRQIINATRIGLSFVGNRTEPDYFKLLERDGDYLLVGARNIVYNISITDFAVKTPIVWPSSEKDVRECQMKGKNAEECHNYIRVLAKDTEDGVIVCGTNAFKPRCRIYSLDKDGSYVSVSEFAGNAISPYDPAHNSTAVYVAERKEIFSGTVADFVGADPLIYRHQVAKPSEIGLRTERSDIKCLSDPNFVSSFADKDFVYFWFRESAVEYMNCGKAIYSRVARICKNDQGGPRNDKLWTTYLKARLNCSVPGDFPYYFDEIEATSMVISGRYGSLQTPLVYAVFNTPYNTIRASAVCAFSMEDIEEIFSQGAFKSQPSPNANWLPILKSQVPTPRPGNCELDSRQISDEAAAFIKRNPLMDDAVPNYFNEPLLVQSALKSRFTQIVVHPQVPTADGQRYDVIFLGTDTGKVMKMVNVAEGRQVNAIIVEIVHVFASRSKIKNMLLYQSSPSNEKAKRSSKGDGDKDTNALIVVSDNEVRSIPLYFCEKATTCSACVRLQDPYCAWDAKSRSCVGITNGGWTDGDFIQNVKTGQVDSQKCPPDPFDNVLHNEDAVPENADVLTRRTTPSSTNDDSNASDFPDSPGSNSSASANKSFPSAGCRNCSRIDEKHSARSENSKPFASVSSVTSEQIHDSHAAHLAATQSQLAVAVVSTLFVSLAVGFVCGVLFSNRAKLRAKMLKQKAADEQQFSMKPMNFHHTSTNGSSTVGGGHHKTNAPINAFESSPKLNDTGITEVEIELGDCEKAPDKNSVNNYNSFTLPKDYKVKKVYL